MAKTKADRIMEMAANVALSEIGAGPEITGFSNRDDARAALAALVDEVAPAPADPALLALAKLGAMVLDWSPLECGFPAMPGSVIDTMAVKSGCSLEDSGDGGHACCIAPNVRLAIAALLAPDGAASEGVTG